MPTDTSLPPIAQEMERLVQDRLNPDSSTSIPVRAEQFDKTVDAQASPDREVGAARVAPSTAVGSMIAADAVDTAQAVLNAGRNAIDGLTRGTGDAYGEQLTDQEKDTRQQPLIPSKRRKPRKP